jgi:hypothetical protein
MENQMKKLLAALALTVTASNVVAAAQIMNGPKPVDSCGGYEVQTAGSGQWYLLPYSVVNGSPSGTFQLNTLTTSQIAYSNSLPAVKIGFDVTGSACGVPTIANVRFGS